MGGSHGFVASAQLRMSVPDEYAYELNTNVPGWVLGRGLLPCTSFPTLAGVTVNVKYVYLTESA